MSLGRFSFAGFTLAVILGGCTGGLGQGAPVGASGGETLAGASAEQGGSWMKPEAYTGALLYVSDPGAGVVNVLTYPNGKRIGKLTGFVEPRGECVDASGNVYVTDEGASDVLEYAHGGTTPMRTIEDPGQKPYDCAVNLNAGNLTGNFAIVNAGTTSGGPGSVTVYGGRVAGTYKMTKFLIAAVSRLHPSGERLEPVRRRPRQKRKIPLRDLESASHEVPSHHASAEHRPARRDSVGRQVPCRGRPGRPRRNDGHRQVFDSLRRVAVRRFGPALGIGCAVLSRRLDGNRPLHRERIGGILELSGRRIPGQDAIFLRRAIRFGGE